ncbi:MAG: hypothetical protein ACQESR_31100 [Planctomycetota bacterium]
MERCPAQAVLPLVGLAAEKVIRDRSNARQPGSVSWNGVTGELRMCDRRGAAFRDMLAGATETVSPQGKMDHA